MNKEHFQNQISRLISVYGEKAYPNERVALYWQAVRDFSDRWLTKTVDYFIAYHQYPPLKDKWDEQISKAREEQYETEKRQNTKDAEEFMSKYSGDDIKTICAQIRDRINGKMNDQAFECFKQILTGPREIKCKRCDDTKVYIDKERGGMWLCDHKHR